MMIENILSQRMSCMADLYFCGERVQSFHHEYGPEIRTYYIIELVVDGEAVLWRNGQELPIQKNDLFVIFPGENVHYRALTPWSIKWVGIGSADLAAFLSQIGITPQCPAVSLKAPEKLRVLFDQIMELSYDLRPMATMHANALLCELLACVAEERADTCTASVSRASDILRYIAAHFQEPIRIGEIADRYHMDRSSLERSFLRETGCSMRETITRFRLERAKAYLMESTLSVNEIALQCGFTDALYFSKFFRRYMDLSPSSYREKWKQKRAENLHKQ